MAIEQLPEAYAKAIELFEAGADQRTIATTVGVEVEAVSALLRVAERKLVALLCDSVGDEER